VSSLPSGRMVIHKHGDRTEITTAGARRRCSPRTDVDGAQRARSVVPDGEHQQLLVVVYGIWLLICEAYQRTGAGSSENYCGRRAMEQSLLRHEYQHWRSRCEIAIAENNNAGGTMKNHWQDRQSEIRLGNSQCVVRAAAIEDDDAEVLNWLPQVRCKSGRS
jgi:hypothetical protein